MYFNAGSLNTKTVELQALLISHEYDVILITETWLKSYHKDSELCSKSKYSIIRSDRHDNQSGGGVCAFIKFDLSKKVNIITKVSEEKQFDIIIFDLYIQSNTVLRFVCIYLPPDSAKNYDVVIKIVDILNNNFVNNCTYIYGDFNFSKVLWKMAKFPTHHIVMNLIVFITFC